MSLSKPWKALERRTARLFDGVRLWRPDYSDSAPDGEAIGDVWDCKCYKRFSVIEMYVRCERKYREFAAGRRFILVLFSREHPRAGDFVLSRSVDYARLVRVEEAAKEARDLLAGVDVPAVRVAQDHLVQALTS